MPNSRFALHGKRPSLLHGLCAIFASNSRSMRPFQNPLDTCLCTPFFPSLSVHGLHFTVCAPSMYQYLNFSGFWGCSRFVASQHLRGPAGIVFISRDACSDSIANSVMLVFMGIAQFRGPRMGG